MRQLDWINLFLSSLYTASLSPLGFQNMMKSPRAGNNNPLDS
jgi:hypothetical protein